MDRKLILSMLVVAFVLTVLLAVDPAMAADTGAGALDAGSGCEPLGDKGELCW